jgi:hypothetical protein
VPLKEVNMTLKDEEEPRRTSWAIWLPVIVVTIGVAIWFLLFVISDFGA